MRVLRYSKYKSLLNRLPVWTSAKLQQDLLRAWSRQSILHGMWVDLNDSRVKLKKVNPFTYRIVAVNYNANRIDMGLNVYVFFGKYWIRPIRRGTCLKM